MGRDMQLRDKCVVSGQGVPPVERRCMFYNADGARLNNEGSAFRFVMEARLMVKPDAAIEAIVTPSGMTATHHGRQYRVEGLTHQYSNRGKLLHHVLQLRDVQG